MRIIHGKENYKHQNNKLFIALGNFDGLHLAHRSIIGKTCLLAKQNKEKSAVFLFDPHPVTKLFSRKDFLLISSVKRRAEILEELEVDFLIIEEFNDEIAMLPPYHFVVDYLVNTFRVGGVVVGFDYTFGKRGRGTATHLLKWGEKFNFAVEVVPPVIVGNEVVSSSLIRKLLTRGEVKNAAQYLGTNYKISGLVVHGEGRGKKLGFPTANLQIQDGLILPANGVYLSAITYGDKRHFALTNIGSKPTFHRGNRVVVEVFLIDYCGNLYGEELTVEFLHRIRKEAVFTGANSLKEQINIDLSRARELIQYEYSRIADNACR